MQLFKHQQEVIDLNPSRYLLAHETGTGKTITAIKLADKNGGNSLVICPKSLKDNWEEEIAKWSDSPDSFRVVTKEMFRKNAKVTLRYENVICDECHFFAGYSPKSLMFKSLDWYIKKHNPDNIWLLTATPFLSTPWNIYAYAQLLGYNWSWYKFRNEFFTEVRMGPKLIPVLRPGSEKKIAQLVNILGNTVKMSDAVDVPESVFMTEHFRLTQQQKKAISTLDDLMHIVRWTKIHQICGGTLKGDEYTEAATFKSEKLARLKELASEHPRIAVVCRYNHEIEVLKKELEKINKVFVIQGQTKSKHSVINEIDTTESCIVLINAACSEGYNLSSIPMMIFYSYDFSLKNYIQMKGRIQRINKVQKCIYMSLIVKGTIDEDVYKSVVVKKQDFHLEIYNQ